MSGKKEIILSEEIVLNQIYFIRGQKVMLDRDLAVLYGVETRVLKQSVKRNIDRFPSDFMFELTKMEFELWRSQNVTSKADKIGLRYAPFAFTEQGVAMLSSVLNSKRAIGVNIQIIRIFTKIKQVLIDTSELKTEIEQIRHKLGNQSKNIELIFQYLDELLEKKENNIPREKVGYKLKNIK